MVFDLTTVIILMLIGAVATIWWKSKEAQERALLAARAYCKSMGLQLLDECVIQSNWEISRAEDGRRCFIRRYQFEFTSTGHERYFGEVIMKGQRLQNVHVEPHRVSQ
ncbi:DUF3301 domain-containing protein [Echinimonas agarilytica]|uniref:DUF3301 domain-containing protein n=1 Tax=Echinimonas agarilytica TaxID=1215918 RepID=A0AA41W5R2_9GAMM|nr:DUF3301 domain-containing protein [Echinimonas agarilytica]MCM2679018.1 DUF3301 domain-containing protein [Echinimonas agarilytica]